MFGQICLSIESQLSEKTVKSDVRDCRVLPTSGIVDRKYWSFGFTATVRYPDGRIDDLYIKIPKVDWGEQSIVRAISNPSAKRIAEEEYWSLQQLHGLTNNSSLLYRSIEPIAFIKEWNAIVTRRVDAQPLYQLLRGMRENGKGNGSAMWVRYCGEWLRHVHEGVDRCERGVSAVGDALDNSNSLLEVLVPGTSQGQRLLRLQQRFSQIVSQVASWSIPVSLSVPGFEVRNVLVNSDAIYVLDPGHLHPRPSWFDISNFLVSLDILYWGKPSFLWAQTAYRSYHKAFLTGYFGNNCYDEKGLTLFVLHGLLRFWADACVVLDWKRYPAIVKRFLRRVYLDQPYFQKCERVIREVERLE